MKNEIEDLVREFAFHKIAQDEAVLQRHDSDVGNRHAKGRIAAFKTLIAKYGDEGREALTTLFGHTNRGVRCTAAAYLLRYKHDEAMSVLKELAKGDDFAAFGAQCSIDNWHSGAWELDPEPDDNPA